MPIVISSFDMTLADASRRMASNWQTKKEGEFPTSLDGWSSGQISLFLDTLLLSPTPLPLETIQKMDLLYHFTESRNAEICFRWYQLCIRSGYVAAFPQIVHFLKSQGRMKYVRPLYRSLYNSEKGKELALKTFTQYRAIYHNIAAKMIAKDLQVSA